MAQNLSAQKKKKDAQTLEHSTKPPKQNKTNKKIGKRKKHSPKNDFIHHSIKKKRKKDRRRGAPKKQTKPKKKFYKKSFSDFLLKKKDTPFFILNFPYYLRSRASFFFFFLKSQFSTDPWKLCLQFFFAFVMIFFTFPKRTNAKMNKTSKEQRVTFNDRKQKKKETMRKLTIVLDDPLPYYLEKRKEFPLSID